MRGAFWRLYLKELKGSLNYTILLAFGVGWLIFLPTQKLNWGSEIVFGLSFIPLLLLPVYILIKGFLSFRSEWKSDTVYSLLSLPVPGWYILLAKLLAAMTILTGLSIIFIIGIYLDSRLIISWTVLTFVPRNFGIGIYLKMLLCMYIISWFLCVIGYVIIQFSYLVSKLFNRFSGFITGVTFLFTLWVVFRIGSIINKLLFWIPDLKLITWAYRNQILHHDIAYINISPFIGIIIASIGLFFVSAWLLENVLEI